MCHLSALVSSIALSPELQSREISTMEKLSVVAGELFQAKQYLFLCMSTSIHFEHFEEKIKFPIAKFSFCSKGQEEFGDLLCLCSLPQGVLCKSGCGR